MPRTTIGYDGRGKRVVKRASGRTKTEARDKLRALMRDHADGYVIGGRGVTVESAVQDWLAFGLVNRSAKTVELNRYLCETHVIPHLGARQLHELDGGGGGGLVAAAPVRPEYADHSDCAFVPEPCGSSGDAARFGEAERRRVD